jgi:hypothetical protein
MCIFCAAIPVAGSLGAMASSKQRLQIRQAEEQGKAPPKPFIPAGKAALGVIGGLMICSAIYHTQLKLPY